MNDLYINRDDRRPVIIFGNFASASLARFLLDNDSPYQVAGFTVDREYCKSTQHEGLPLVPFDSLEHHFSPNDFQLLIPMGYQKINHVRRDRYENAKLRGYSFVSYVSSRASIWPGLEIGENTLIYEHAIIQPFATIGNNSIIRSGAHISHHCAVGDHVFVAAEVAMGGKVLVGDQAFLGVGSVIVDSIEIASRSFIGAGAVVTRPTEELGVYVGNPARKLGKSALDL